MATTYNELLSEIQSELDNDSPNLIAAIPTFVHRAERRFNRMLRTLAMECRSSHPALPVGTPDEEKGVYSLPADWHSFKTMEVREGTIIWAVYFRKIQALSASNQSNWLLDNHDDLYLYASLLFAEPWLKNDTRIAMWATFAEGAISEIINEDMDSRYGGAPLRSRIGSERLYHGYRTGQGQYEYIPPVQFFDLESVPQPANQPRSGMFGLRPGVFTVAEQKLRILPKPGGVEAGTPGWTACL